MTAKAKNVKKTYNNKSFWVYVLFMIWPTLQFAVFYIGVNFSSFLLAFKKIDVVTNTTVWTFENIKNQFLAFGSLETQNLFKISLIGYGMHIIVGVPLGLIFSFYIYKKRLLSGAFRFLLFLPSIIPAIVLCTVYRYFLDAALPQMLKEVFGISGLPEEGLFSAYKLTFGTIIFYNVFVGFGTSVLMYSNHMSTIDPSLSEAANLDGATGFQEFWHVALPMSFSTLSVFLITGVISIFNGQMNLFSFFGWDVPADFKSFGYYLFYETSKATTNNDIAAYPKLAALGLILTFIAVPITFFVRWLCNKFGPSED